MTNQSKYLHAQIFSLLHPHFGLATLSTSTPQLDLILIPFIIWKIILKLQLVLVQTRVHRIHPALFVIMYQFHLYTTLLSIQPMLIAGLSRASASPDYADALRIIGDNFASWETENTEVGLSKLKRVG